MKTVSVERLRSICSRVFAACGAAAGEVEILTDELIESSLLGIDTHGVVLLSQYVYEVLDRTIRPGAPFTILRETPSTAVVDCGFDFGLVSARRIADLVIRKAGSAHIACVVSQRTHHVSRLGSHVQKLADSGFIGLGYVAASTQYGHRPIVAPWGGREGRFSTNPLAYAVPTRDLPIVFDMSTAMTSQGRVRAAIRRSETLPEGYIQDGEGRPTTDPNDLYGSPPGSILPFGFALGHKGYGLALLTEIMAGTLAGRAVDPEDLQDHYSNQLCLIAMDPESFCGREEFYDLAAELSVYLSATPPAPGFEEVVLPGTLERRTRARRLVEGIPIDEEGWNNMKKAASRVGIDIEA
ncbi:MAG: Ldh family oxidoreductase [Spirochaetales bacterium]|nr:Ldh family oxidoreductase [Spirochaetales bacterium]